MAVVVVGAGEAVVVVVELVGEGAAVVVVLVEVVGAGLEVVGDGQLFAGWQRLLTGLIASADVGDAIAQTIETTTTTRTASAVRK